VREKYHYLPVKNVILKKYNTEKQHTYLGKTLDDTQKATLLFKIFLNFIIDNNWEYVSLGNDYSSTCILESNSSVPLSVNCFELSDTFKDLCNQIGIIDVDIFQYRHQPLQLEKKLPGSSYVFTCFDTNQTYVDNETIFDLHSVVTINGRFYDLTFSCIYDEVDSPFANDPFLQMVSFIDSKNEKASLRLLKELDAVELTRTFAGETLLYQAVSSDLYHLALMLLEKAGNTILNINYQDLTGWTLLHWAAVYGREDIASSLLTLGADANIKTTDEFPQTALECVKNSQSTLFNLLYKHTEKSFADSVLFLDVSNKIETCSAQYVIDAVNKRLYINQQSTEGWTLLHWAAHYGREDIVLCLLNNGADADIKTTDEVPQTPLECVNNSQPNLFELLCSYTTKPLSEKTQTILLSIAMTKIAQGDIYGLMDNCEKLDVNLQDNRGWTLLHEAVSYKKKAIIDWLIHNGADKDIKNNNGKTAFELCIRSEHQKPATLSIAPNSPRFFSSEEQGDKKDDDPRDNCIIS
jgi:ankyrin repeat protein